MKRQAVLMALLAMWAPAFSQTNGEASAKINACLQSGTGVPTQLHHDICIDAANAAWVEAEKEDVHSEQGRQLYWLQAGEAANIAMLTQVKIDQDMSSRACQIAKFGLQCFNQVDPEGPMSAHYQEPEMMRAFYQNCEAQGYFDQQE